MRAERVEPVQLDLLDWLEAQVASPNPVENHGGVAPTPTPAAPVVLTRVDPSCNMHRFYSVEFATSLFGEPGVERAWGRIGSRGRRRTDWFAAPEAARAEMAKMVGTKQRRGYRPSG